MMIPKSEEPPPVERLDQELVLMTLEPDQLAEAKKQRVPRRRLKGDELFILWTLRIYVLFMIAVIIYQAWRGGR